MPGFLQFLAAVVGVLGLVGALGALMAPGLGIPVAVGIAVGTLCLAGLLAGIAGIALRIENQTRINSAIFTALDEALLRRRELAVTKTTAREGRNMTAEEQRFLLAAKDAREVVDALSRQTKPRSRPDWEQKPRPKGGWPSR